VEKEVYEKTEKLISLEKVDFIIAYIDLKVLPVLQPLLNAKDKIMMVVNPGANYPDNWISSGNFIYLTLQHSFLCWLTGMKAGLKQDKNAVVATNFYDAGYLNIAAMTQRFQAEQGRIVYNYINRDIYTEINLADLEAFISNGSIQHILAVFDSITGRQFMEAANRSPVFSNKFLFVSPMLLEESFIREQTYDFSLSGHVSSLATAGENAEIKDYFKEHEGRPVSIFGIQGWEAGLIVSRLFNTEYSKPETVLSILASSAFQTPRGEIRFDTKTNYFISPVYFINKIASDKNLTIEQCDYADEEWNRFTDNPVQGLTSGWTNTYLCY
jgi:hypothetical protein